MVKPTVISTFAGCGGSSLGYQMAGFHELLAVEWDQNAVDTFRLNFPDVPVYHGDIAKLTGAECMRLAGIEKGALDVLDGSPPCQGFSTAGKRKFDDPRNSLFKEYARLLNELQPKVFVMENVTGMVKGCMKQAYLTIIKTLRDCGYKAKGEVMNAMYFNVPQSRERVIIIGVREDLGIEPSHPKPLNKPISVNIALHGVQNRTFCNTDYSKHRRGEHVLKDLIAMIKPGENATNYLNGGGFSMQRLDKNKPSPTIQKTFPGSKINLIHFEENRQITIEEAKRLATFPDYFKFIGEYRNQWARIGNSVPPNLMKAIAEHIKINILSK
jgi:DNA (cytosine-5)-methyltransferase 1